MGLFPKIKPKPKINDKRMRKLLDSELANYAKKDDIDAILNERADTERRRQLWAAMSVRMRLKVLKYLKERKDAHAKKR